MPNLGLIFEITAEDQNNSRIPPKHWDAEVGNQGVKGVYRRTSNTSITAQLKPEKRKRNTMKMTIEQKITGAYIVALHVVIIGLVLVVVGLLK